MRVDKSTGFPIQRRRRLPAVLLGAALVTSVVLVAGPAATAPMTTTFSYAGPPVAIPDAADLTGTNPGAPASASVTASGLFGPLTDVDLRIDGTSCDATAGSTTVGIDHTFVNDLELRLTSPEGTTVTVIDNTDGSGNNFCQVLLDDEAGTTSIQTAVTANAPFQGSWSPANPLSAFDGEDPNGVWTLQAQDFFSQDTGSIRAFSVLISTNPTNELSAVKTVSGAFEEGGTVTYGIAITNTGTGPSTDNPGDELTDVLPGGLTLVSATASAGTAVATVGTNTVTWNGGVPVGGTVNVTITATINSGTAGDTIANQATLAYDADANGTNETSVLSDDVAGGSLGATTFPVSTLPLVPTEPTTPTEPAAPTPVVAEPTFTG
jgi:uncharacterized repeat protein (TIGR01451 family)